MIDFIRLAYADGIAVAAILKSQGAGLRKAAFLPGGAPGIGRCSRVGFAVPRARKLRARRPNGLAGVLNLTFYLSKLTVGVGVLSGRGGLIFALGGFLGYWLLSPQADPFRRAGRAGFGRFSLRRGPQCVSRLTVPPAGYWNPDR